MKTFVMRRNASGNEIGHAKGETATEAAQKIWDHHCDSLVQANPHLEDCVNREIPWASVSVHPI